VGTALASAVRAVRLRVFHGMHLPQIQACDARMCGGRHATDRGVSTSVQLSIARSCMACAPRVCIFAVLHVAICHEAINLRRRIVIR